MVAENTTINPKEKRSPTSMVVRLSNPERTASNHMNAKAMTTPKTVLGTLLTIRHL
jgi:hypothetical protein